MEKVFYYECVARCSVDGTLVMGPGMVDAAIQVRYEHLHALRGVAYYRELLSLGDFCVEHRHDGEAMDAYMEVLDHVLFDYRLPMRVRRQLYSHAARGLISLCGSPEEVVWEICSQLREGLENYAV